MYRTTAILIAALWTTGPYAKGPEVTLEIGTLELAGHQRIQNIQLRCPALDYSAGIGCNNGQFSAMLPGFGRINGTIQAQFENSTRWHAQISVVRKEQKLKDVQKLAAALGTKIPGELSGTGDIQLQAELTPATTRAKADILLTSLNYSESSGRYASEKLVGRIQTSWDSATQRGSLTVDSHSGQIYLEPLFLDFSVLPLHAEIQGHAKGSDWQLDRIYAEQAKAGTLQGTGLITKALKLKQLDLQLDARDLAPLIAADLQPFLIGTRLEGLKASGGLRASVEIRDQKPVSLKATLREIALDADKLGLSFTGLNGNLNWAAAHAAPSLLKWSAATAQKVSMGPSQIAFRTQDRDFELLSPWQQPLLEGALNIERLALHGLGTPGLTADFSGELKPINLQALCKALGWPEFGGTLGGRLPGLTIRDNVWSVEGALEAQAFDGSVRLEHLRAIEPFGVLPRVTADIHLRRLDLERLTSVYSFGRITGRLDGDVEGLRLLAWKPVAFDGRIYSSANDDSRRRISQRAIDNISSIGGGPTGVLSRGFLSMFEDFAYDRIGISCVLRNGRCQMDGIAPTGSDNGQAGYYLVKGRLLPRIDVVGYAHSVSWNSLLDQIKAAQASGGPQTKAP